MYILCFAFAFYKTSLCPFTADYYLTLSIKGAALSENSGPV